MASGVVLEMDGAVSVETAVATTSFDSTRAALAAPSAPVVTADAGTSGVGELALSGAVVTVANAAWSAAAGVAVVAA